MEREKGGASWARNAGSCRSYQECALKEKPGEMAPQCKAAGVKLFPSWQFGSNPPTEGVFSLDELSDKTGCSLP